MVHSIGPAAQCSVHSVTVGVRRGTVKSGRLGCRHLAVEAVLEAALSVLSRQALAN